MILDKNNLTAKNKPRFGQTRSMFFSSFAEEAGFDPMQGCGGSVLAGETNSPQRMRADDGRERRGAGKPSQGADSAARNQGFTLVPRRIEYM
jgi:hypothetical protein